MFSISSINAVLKKTKDYKKHLYYEKVFYFGTCPSRNCSHHYCYENKCIIYRAGRPRSPCGSKVGFHCKHGNICSDPVFGICQSPDKPVLFINWFQKSD